ncbi:hypothetical protein [Pseudomonas sp.]|jgi:hypothetical protein|uniref:hypothetical protein n=1 Tax=Pseudomonas sp. TaxID=306 RepID=UPI003FD860E1
MTKDSVADELRALASGDKSRSETARLRDIVAEVEAALSAGVSRAAVLEALNAQGFTMTLKSFESALYRIRKKRTQPAKAAVKIGHDQTAESASQPTKSLQQDPQTRIANPADIRKSRRREIDLDDLSDKE